MEKFERLTNDEVYILKRAMIESAAEIFMIKVYDKPFHDAFTILLNEIIEEDSKRMREERNTNKLVHQSVLEENNDLA